MTSISLKPASRASFVFAVAATVAAGATQMSAQSSGSQGGLRAGGSSDQQARQKLNITLSSTGAHDSDTSPETRTSIGLGDSGPAGYSTMLVGTADYLVQGRRVQFRATGTSSLRYSRPLEDVLSPYYKSVSHTVGIGVSAQVTPRTTLLVNQAATYSPSSLYNLFARPTDAALVEAPPAAPDYAMKGSESQSYGTSMSLVRDLSPRNSFSAVADYQRMESTFLSDLSEERREMNSYGIRGRFSHHLTRNAMTTADYHYSLANVGTRVGATTVQTLANQGAEVGVDYRRPLSASRSLSFGARIGMSIMRLPESTEDVGPDGRRYNQLSGQATFSYQFLRTWRANAIYLRGVEYVPGLSQPVARDSVTTGIDGSLTRRVNVLASAAYASGGSALNRTGSTFDSYTGDVRLRYAWTRTFSTYVEYLYYFYDSRGTPLTPGIPSGLERKGVRAGLTLQVPAL